MKKRFMMIYWVYLVSVIPAIMIAALSMLMTIKWLGFLDVWLARVLGAIVFFLVYVPMTFGMRRDILNKPDVWRDRLE